MRKALLSIAMLCCGIVAMMLAAAPANAQANRTWVSGVGDDANPCSRTAPCKTFAGAISKTAPSGEINVLDPGGFGAVTITKSISIIADHVEAGVLVQGTNGIVVSLANATDHVLLEGLDIEGLGTGVNGVRMIGSGFLTIRRCEIRNFAQKGVDLEGSAGARVYLQDSLVYKNAGGGFFSQGANGATNNAVIERTTFDLNGTAAVKVVGPGQVILSQNLLAFTTVSLDISNGATAISYSNNIFRGSGSPTQTLTTQ